MMGLDVFSWRDASALLSVTRLHEAAAVENRTDPFTTRKKRLHISLLHGVKRPSHWNPCTLCEERSE